jgi:Glycosyl transferases group 1
MSQKTKVLVLSDAYMLDGTFDSYTRAMIMYLLATGLDVKVIKTNSFIKGLSSDPYSKMHLQVYLKLIKEFEPDVIFTVNRNGMLPEVYELLPAHTKIVTWILDPFNRLPASVMNFTPNDHINLIMFDMGFGSVKKAKFLEQFPIQPEQLSLVNVFVDSLQLFPQEDGTERPTDVIFVGTAFSMDRFTCLAHEISKDPQNRDVFMRHYLRHKRVYQFDFLQNMLNDGFDLNRIENNEIRSRIEAVESFQGIVDDQITLERRINHLSAMSEFKLKVFGQPGLFWIQQMATVNSDLLACFQYDYVRTYEEIARLYNQSKIAFNIQHHLARDSGFSFRVLDIIATKSLLMTEVATKQPLEYLGFKENVDFVCYSSPTELHEKCAYYLSREGERQAVVNSAYEKFKKIEPEYSLKSQMALSFERANLPELAGCIQAITHEKLTAHADFFYEGKDDYQYEWKSAPLLLGKKLITEKKLFRLKTRLGPNLRLSFSLDSLR